MQTQGAGQHIRMRIVVVYPPPSVRFAVPRGKSELLAPSAHSAESIQFDLALRLGAPLLDGSVNFLGEFAQGTPADRFVYLNSALSRDRRAPTGLATPS